jgi:putative salt-induced outer membrane protein YdiY
MDKHFIKKALILSLAITASLTASAQGKWKYHLGFGGELKDGNVNVMTLRNDGSVERNDSTLAFDAGYAIVYGEKDKVAYDKSFDAHVKFDLWQYDRWSPFLSASYLNNEFKGFDYRISALLGVKYRIFWNDRCDYSISAAYVQDYTEYGDPAVTLKAMVSRLSLRFKMRHKIGDNLTLKHTTFWQPSVMEPMTSITNDYVVSSVTSLSTKISEHLSFDINFNYEYHSLVPDGVQKQDIITSATLRLDV